MYDIQEGLFSNMTEIYNVSKQVTAPFQKFLADMKSLRMKEADPKKIRARLGKMEMVVASSKMKGKMKQKFIRNMHSDIYGVMRDHFSDPKIQDLFGWSDKQYHPILIDYNNR